MNEENLSVSSKNQEISPELVSKMIAIQEKELILKLKS